MLNGLCNVNIELTSRCNKSCWCCGRRKIERDYPALVNWGDMEFKLIQKIAKQLPEGIVVQFHNNGEPLLYPQLYGALRLFKNQVRTFNTNGLLLVEKAVEIIDNLDTLVISVIENDPLANEQYDIITTFLEMKGAHKPYIIFRLLGDVDSIKYERHGLIASRVLHSPMGSYNYKKKVTIPEIGICLDMLHHLAIDRYGKVSICVRFDPTGLGVIGDLNKESLDDIWNGEKRKKWLDLHLKGQRNKVPLCSTCDFWGVPTGRKE